MTTPRSFLNPRWCSLVALLIGVLALPSRADAAHFTAESPAHESTQSGASDPIQAISERGLVGETIVVGASKPLRAKPEQPLSAPMLVRVSEVAGDETQGGGRRYRIEFIGSIAGEYDLRDSIEYIDGTPATDLSPIRVRVESQLPSTHGSDLFAVPEPPFRLESHYRAMLVAIGVLWLLIPTIVLIRRRLRRPAPAPIIPQAPPPTLADVLRPLVERARTEGLSLREQASLELLLLHYWRDRLGIADAPAATAIATMRAHPEAGTLIRAVERWLHARGAGNAKPTEDIAELLAPYVSVDAPLVWPPSPKAGDAERSAPDAQPSAPPAGRAMSKEVRR